MSEVEGARGHGPAGADWTPSPTPADVSRRRFVTSATAGVVAAGLAAGSTGAQEAAGLQVRTRAFAETHQPKPLPFEAGSLNGLSARLIESHWSNNYGGSVRALNAVNKRLAAALGESDLPPYVYNDLKREHLMRTGSVVLHELYFDNLGGGGPVDARTRELIGSAFGGFDRWESEFRRIAAGLGGGSGWVVLGYNRHLGALENYWMADHMHSAAATDPLLVMDMYEHSYHIDFGAAAARYIDAFFVNINWETVVERIEALRA
jgi:Fe-Mn family superoxide dismutase